MDTGSGILWASLAGYGRPMGRRKTSTETSAAEAVREVVPDAPAGPALDESVTEPVDGPRFHTWQIVAAVTALVVVVGVVLFLVTRCSLSADQQRVIEEFGLPRTFTIVLGDGEAQARLESWEYYELGSAIHFRDGEVVGTTPIAALDPEQYAYPALSPEDFEEGMTAADVTAMLAHGPESVESTAIPGAEHALWSGAVEAGFTDEVLAAIRTTALEVGTDGAPIQLPLQGDVTITEAIAVWDVKSGPVEQVVPLQWAPTEGDVGWIATRLEALLEDQDFAAPVERAVLEAKLRGARMIVAEADPTRPAGEVAPIAVQLVIEVETSEEDVRTSGHDYANRYLERLYAGLGWVMPVLVGEEASSTDTQGGDRATAAAARTAPVNRAPMTEGTWYVEAIVWKADGTVDPLAAPRQPFTTSDLLRYGDKLCQYWFERDGEFGHQHEAVFGEGTYTESGPTGDLSFAGPLPMDETVRSASYYFDEANGTLYIIEHWIDKWDGKMYDRVLRMAR